MSATVPDAARIQSAPVAHRRVLPRYGRYVVVVVVVVCWWSCHVGTDVRTTVLIISGEVRRHAIISIIILMMMAHINWLALLCVRLSTIHSQPAIHRPSTT